MLFDDCEEAGWDWYSTPITRVSEADYHVKINI